MVWPIMEMNPSDTGLHLHAATWNRNFPVAACQNQLPQDRFPGTSGSGTSPRPSPLLTLPRPREPLSSAGSHRTFFSPSRPSMFPRKCLNPMGDPSPTNRHSNQKGGFCLETLALPYDPSGSHLTSAIRRDPAQPTAKPSHATHKIATPQLYRLQLQRDLVIQANSMTPI